MSVTKSEFVDRVADQAGLSAKAVRQTVDAMPSVLAEGLHADSEVTIDGLGSFSLDEKKKPKFQADPEFEATLIKIEDTGGALPEAQ